MKKACRELTVQLLITTILFLSDKVTKLFTKA